MLKISNKRALLSIGLAVAPASAWASGAPAATLAQLLTNSGITASGYLAATYYHSSGGNTYHQVDTRHDAFPLDQAGLTLAYRPLHKYRDMPEAIRATANRRRPRT